MLGFLFFTRFDLSVCLVYRLWLGPREFCICMVRGCVFLRFNVFPMRSSALSSVRVHCYVCVKSNMNTREIFELLSLTKNLDFLTL